MRFASSVLVLCSAVACGLAACGGGGGGSGVGVAAPARLVVDAVDIAAGVTAADLVVRLDGTPEPQPALLEVAVELPPQLTLAANDRLVASRAVATLDGDWVGNRFVILCGDAQNASAAPLAPGALFRLRLVPTLPRQPGTWTVTLHDLRTAANDGTVAPAAGAPVTVAATIR